jgi:hypothetical protein
MITGTPKDGGRNLRGAEGQNGPAAGHTPVLPGQPRLFAKGVQFAVAEGDKEGVF